MHESPQNSPTDQPGGIRKKLAEFQTMIEVNRPGLSSESPEFRGALLLLMIDEIGANVARLVRRSGLPREFVARGVRRLVDNGWTADARTASGWPEHPPACEPFWRDVQVLLGLSHRRITGEGRVEWAPVGEWVKDYDYQGARTGDLAIHNEYRKVTLHDPEPQFARDSEDGSAGNISSVPPADDELTVAVPISREEPADSPIFLGGTPTELLGGTNSPRTGKKPPVANDAGLLVDEWGGANWLG
ncbi:hypothetical protein BH23GEM6_BH23GEM6_11860 [soil metagenome]